MVICSRSNKRLIHQRRRKVLRDSKVGFAPDHTAGEGGPQTQTGLTLKAVFVLRH